MSMNLESDAHPQPFQFKGEIMDFDIGMEMDHRKRRRNRTTQSCLNCHTSKRKCDRKRPCQRCIQLGLTGLCVYEVDDPAMRDDPNVDESTRLRNRIAELESLVRELRGKPHPRWAEPTFCDGDSAEKWHSRSTKRVQNQQYPKRREMGEGEIHAASIAGSYSNASPPIKSEHVNEMVHHQPHLYRFTPSPDSPSMADSNPGSATYRYTQYSHSGHGVVDPSSENLSACYPSSSSSGSNVAYGQHRHPGPPQAADINNDQYYHQPYIRHPPDSIAVQPSCTCLTNPAAGNPLIALTQQLRDTLNLLRQLPEHNTRQQQCVILNRINELNDIMHGNNAADSDAYDPLPSQESELMSPVSASSQSSQGTPIYQWSTMETGNGYETYFPVGEPGVYKTYHIH